MGICNGFQILCESHLLPGALLHNANQKFICDNVYLKTETSQTAVTSGITKDSVLKIPIAHGEGRYLASEDVLKGLWDNDQILFTYCDKNGELSPGSNPNGSTQHIAGICNSGRNVFGMMPHPERAADTNLSNTDGKLIFDSILSLVTA